MKKLKTINWLFIVVLVGGGCTRGNTPNTGSPDATEDLQPVVEVADAGIKTPQPVIAGADAGIKTPAPVIEMADTGIKTPQSVIEVADVGTETPPPVIADADMGIKTPPPVIEVADAGIKTPQSVIEGADVGTETPPPVIADADMGIKKSVPTEAPQSPVIKTPVPVVEGADAGIKTPVLVFEVADAGTETPPPVIADADAGIKTPVLVFEVADAGTETPPPVIADADAGIKTPVLVFEVADAGTETPPPVIADADAGIKTPVLVFEVADAGTETPPPVIADADAGIKTPVPVFEVADAGTETPPPVIADADMGIKKSVADVKVADTEAPQSPVIKTPVPVVEGADMGITEAPQLVVAMADTSVTPSASVATDTKKIADTKLDICSFPESLQAALLRKILFKTESIPVEKLKKKAKPLDQEKCSLVNRKNLTQIKKLKITNITEKETKLLGKEYSSYFISLEDLDISGNNNMPALPDFVTSLPKLKKLDISHTGINNLPGAMCNLEKSLTTLIAHNNTYEGQEIPIAVFCLSQLKVLDMSNSSLRYIDEYVLYLRNLEELYLNDNQLPLTPFTLHRMSSLMVLDLRNNSFENKEVNSLHNCKEERTTFQREECQTKLLESVQCEWWRDLPFERGKLGNQSFRARYGEMTGVPYKSRNESLEDYKCYNFWVNSYVSFNDPDDPKKIYAPEKKYLLDLTINGKTVRELRLQNDEIVSGKNEDFFYLNSCQAHFKGISLENGIGSAMYHWFLPKDTSYAYTAHEVHPERYRAPDWERPDYCPVINDETPIPSQPLGPWSEALSYVQDVIDRDYIQGMGCENWPTSRCSDWKERVEKGHPYCAKDRPLLCGWTQPTLLPEYKAQLEENDNNLNSLPPNVFDGLSALQVLDLEEGREEE